MPKRTLALLLLLFSHSVFAQAPAHGKLGASLKLFLAENVKDPRFLSTRNGELFISVFIELVPAETLAPLPVSDMHIRTRAGNIATADIPLSDVEKIAGNPQVKRIELPPLLVKTDTLMKRHTGVDKVLAGMAPLNQAYKGRNVVLGIIDDGLDISHPDFIDSTGKTRVMALWNMDRPGQPPPGFDYGNVWQPDSIDHYVAKFINQSVDRFGMEQRFGWGWHGTPVTGIAAGKNGVAPGADIVSVALTATQDTLLRSDRVIDGIAFIYAKAKELKKKCVINISLGVMDGGPHDGNTLLERAIDYFCAERNDLLIAVSAGNNGNTWKHWGGFPIHKDSSYGFFRCAYKASLYFTIPKKYSDSLSVSIGEAMLGNLNNPNIRKEDVFYQTPFTNITEIIKRATPLSFSSRLPNGGASSTITFTASHYNDEYDELIITTEEYTSGTNGNIFDDHLYRFIFKGSGVVHAWYPFWNLHPIYFFGNNPYPDDPTFRISDNDYTTNIPAHAYSVIASGAFNIRPCYVNEIQHKVVYAYPQCQLTYFTSRGPTLDGRIKPDILAPGENVMTPRSRLDDFLGHDFIVNTNSMAFSGTSASSPVTAGIAAMLWEKNPAMFREEIIQRIRQTAYADDYTKSFGELPNNVAGWGKIDAFNALAGVATEPGYLCSLPMLCEVNRNPPEPGANDPADSYSFKLYPNPAQGYLFLQYRSESPVQLFVHNSKGQLVQELRLPAAPLTSTRQLMLPLLATGIYYVRVSGKHYNSTRMMLFTR